MITGSQPVALAASPRPPSIWSAARGSHPDLLFCRQIPALAGSRHVLAPAEGVEPSTTSFGDSRSEPRRAGVIGSPPRIRTSNDEINSLAPLPIGTVENEIGAEDEDRTRIMSLEGSGPTIGRPPRRRAHGSNVNLILFRDARRPSTPARQNLVAGLGVVPSQPGL